MAIISMLLSTDFRYQYFSVKHVQTFRWIGSGARRGEELNNMSKEDRQQDGRRAENNTLTQ
jgi:hypothetical protein